MPTWGGQAVQWLNPGSMGGTALFSPVHLQALTARSEGGSGASSWGPTIDASGLRATTRQLEDLDDEHDDQDDDDHRQSEEPAEYTEDGDNGHGSLL